MFAIFPTEGDWVPLVWVEGLVAEAVRRIVDVPASSRLDRRVSFDARKWGLDSQSVWIVGDENEQGGVQRALMTAKSKREAQSCGVASG